MSYLRIRPWAQKLLAASALGLSIWGLGATGVALWQDTVIESTQAEIAEAKLTYSRLQEELQAYQGQVAVIANRFSQSPSTGPDLSADVVDIAALSRNLADALARMSTDLDISEAERQRIIRSRDMLHDRIRELEAALGTAEGTIARLRGETARLNADLAESRAETRALIATRGALRGEVAGLEGGLADARRTIAALESQVAGLSEDLAATRTDRAALAQDRAALARRVAALGTALERAHRHNAEVEARTREITGRLAKARSVSLLAAVDRTAVEALASETTAILSDLREARERRAVVEAAIAAILADLERLAGPPSRADGAPGDPVARARALIAALETLQATQADIVARLGERSRGEIDLVERLMDKAGVDLATLIDPPPDDLGQGGPWIDLDEARGPAARLHLAVAALNRDVARVEALRDLAACVPWVAPVDYYHLTSPFGPRKDPINGRNAMHEGVDLAGWPGLAVRAPSAGEVTFAGSKTGYGKLVEIDHGCGIVTRYGHLRRIEVSRGERVSHRQTIGKLGNTGRSTGPHVHYEILLDGEPVDPAKFMEAGRHVFR